MTKIEAIEILKNAAVRDTISPQFVKAYKMAVAALEQQIEKNCNTCKHSGSGDQACKTCGTIYKNYTNWELSK